MIVSAPALDSFLERSALPNPIRSAAIGRPHHPALDFYGRTWSASHLLEATERAAGQLAGAGVAPGEVVALVGPPSPEWVIALHALGWVGAAVAPLPPAGRAPELRAALDAVRPDHLFLTHGLSGDTLRSLRRLRSDARFVTQLPLAPPPPERYWPLDEVRLVLLTSGSTGRPSAVPLTTSQLSTSAFASAIRLGHDPADRWLACLPLHHVGGLSILLRCAFYGTTVVLQHRFDPRAVAASLDGGEASMVSLVPEMLERVLEARPERPFPARLRVVLLGGDAAPPALLERCRRIGAPVALTWGMTEAASQVATRPPGDLRPDPDNGPPLPFVRVESRAGRLALRGPLCSGPLTTRDRGRLDERGRVRVEGREEDTIVSGGETFSAREVEEVLRSHPAVADAGVIGVPDPRWGERPLAALVAREGPPNDEALRAWCRERLSAPKVPDAFAWLPALPRSELGKLRRAALRERLLALDLPGAPAALARPRPADRDPSPPAAAARAEALPPVLQALLAAARKGGVPKVGEHLLAGAELLGGELLRLEEAVADFVRAIPCAQPAHFAAKHLLEQPGKRLRPFCVLLAARLGNAEPRAARDLALASELVHAATLLHDDVLDDGTERRGAPASRVVYGNSASVLGGDYLLTEALRLASPLGAELSDGLLSVIASMVEAEALQLDRRGRFEPDRDAYLRVVRGKTAALFRWALWGGGKLAGLSPDRCAALGRSGDALGVAYQLVDDLLDLSGDPERIGKDALADLRQGKMTWPLVLAAERDAELARELALAAEDPERDVRALLQRVAATGALEQARAFARSQAELAKAELAVLPAGWARTALKAAIAAATERAH